MSARLERVVGGRHRVLFADGPWVMETVDCSAPRVKWICSSPKEAAALIERERSAEGAPITEGDPK